MQTEIISLNGRLFTIWYEQPYQRPLAIQKAQTFTYNVNVCQKAGQSGWAACDEIGGMCEGSDLGDCEYSPTTDCGGVAVCSDVLPSRIPPGKQPLPHFGKQCTCQCQ